MMISLEMVFWTGMAILVVSAWKVMECLVCMLARRLGLMAAVQSHSCSSSGCSSSDLNLQIRKLQKEKAKLESEMRCLKGCKLKSPDFNIPVPVVYVTPTGQCFHTLSKCQYLKDHSAKALKMCSQCSKQSSDDSEGSWLMCRQASVKSHAIALVDRCA